MPFKSVVSSDDLEKLRSAFEKAWIEIEALKRVPLPRALAERDRLGHIVFVIWGADPDCDLPTKAVERYLASAHHLSPESDLAKSQDS
ncbi:hypothetical protein [Bosea lathyri]|uniref:hypothetical protein n=1 Tax=Bosea lathyri TaxID=1036778 RepID=UPI0011B02223|nr:hypothetical protein [Bosea lathyri]